MNAETGGRLTAAERALGQQHSPHRWYREDAVERILADRDAALAKVEKERDDAQHHLAYHLADFRPGVDAEATGDLAVDMAHFAERMRRERDEARAALHPAPSEAP
jgi:hypothetical protein